MTQRPDSAELRSPLSFLDAAAPAWTSACAAVVAAMLTVEGTQRAGAAVIVACALAAAVFAAAVTWRGALADVVAALLPFAALASSGPGAFTSEPLAPFFAQAPGQRALLFLRFALFFVALLRVRGKGPLAALSALLFGSIAVRGLVVACAIGMPIAIRVLARTAPGAPRPFPAAAVVLAAAAALVHLPQRPDREPPAAPREATAYWRARSNLFRAHASAFQWAQSEAPPGEAYLSLAEIDFALGHTETALRVLAKIRAAPASPDVARRAEELQKRRAP